MPLINLSNCKIASENFLGMLGFELRAAGWKASMLSTVLCSPPCSRLMCMNCLSSAPTFCSIFGFQLFINQWILLFPDTLLKNFSGQRFSSDDVIGPVQTERMKQKERKPTLNHGTRQEHITVVVVAAFAVVVVVAVVATVDSILASLPAALF